MRLKQAYEKARWANRKNSRLSCRIVKKNYSGYDAVCEPVELPVIRASIRTAAPFISSPFGGTSNFWNVSYGYG